MKFSRFEISELLKAWLAISLAFAILLSGSIDLVAAILVSAVTVGLGFLLHELAHKFSAQYYGHWAEFRSDDKMLLFAIVSAFLGFIFAAPGAVYIRGNVSKRENGIISAAGPITNLVLAAIFYSLQPILGGFAYYGALINSFLALFNMIPIMNLDGAKVLAWNKVVFGILIGVSFLSYFFMA